MKNIPLRTTSRLAALALLGLFTLPLTAGCGGADAGAPAADEAAAAASVASAVKFDASNSEVQALAAAKGWQRSGVRVGVLWADLVYTTDGWRTTRTATLQYLYNNSRGFLLRGVPQGTAIEYAVHAEVGASYDNFYSYYERATFWANNGGRNYRAVTTDPTGR